MNAVELWKESIGYRFNHAQESHTCTYFRFFFILAGPDPEILLPWQSDVTTSPLYRVRLEGYGWHTPIQDLWEYPPPETLTRNVSSSLGSLTLTACPLTASFRVCSSVGDVELVDSKATDGLLRILPCPFLDTGARCFRLV